MNKIIEMKKRIKMELSFIYMKYQRKKYLDRAFLTRRGVTPAQNPGTLLTLLDNIISFNSPVLCPMNENGVDKDVNLF